MVLDRLIVTDKCRQQHLYLWIVLHHIFGFPDSYCPLSILPYIISSDVQIQYPFIPCLCVESLYEKPVYRLFFLYSHILTFKLLLTIPYLFQDLMKYHIKWYNVYWLTFFLLWHGFVVNEFLSQVFHQQYYQVFNFYPWICGRHFWVQVIPFSRFTFESSH